MNAFRSNAPVVLFDGVCNLCQWSVRFIVRRDRRGVFRFAALQSPAGRALLAGHRLADAQAPDSVVLLEGGRASTGSTAALRIARRLDGAWPLLYALVAVPRPLRDALYRFVARNRYRWFGRQAACMPPTPELRARFLDAGDRG